MKRKWRKFIALLCALTLTVSLSACAGLPGGNGGTPNTVVKRRLVCEVREDSVLTVPADGSEHISQDMTDIPLINLDETRGKLRPGTIIEVAYNAIAEIKPSTPGGILSVTVVEQGEDFLSFYLDLLKGLYGVRKDMNDTNEGKRFAFYGYDLTQVHNLTEGEKGVLLHLFTQWLQQELGCEIGQNSGTFEELTTRPDPVTGEPIPNDLCGTIFTIKDEKAKDGEFTFTAEKWREGFETFTCPESTAIKEDGVWTSSLLEYLADYDEDRVTDTFRVCSVDEHSFLGYIEKEGGSTDGLYQVSLVNVDETKGKLRPGATIEVAYDGTVLETWPGQIPGVESVTVTEQGEDFIGLYLDILNELYEADPGLNPEGSMEESITYAFDLTGVHNLTQEEKNTLSYLFTCSHDTDREKAQPAEHVLGTYEELVEEGYIDGENLYFEHGILFTIEDEPAENGKFKFSTRKWRGGDGAIFYMDCTAEKKEDEWDYELGGFAIS